MEGRPCPKLTVEPDAPALHFDQAFGDIQAQTRAWHFARFHVVGTEEFLEDLCLIFDADANPIVFHPEMDNALAPSGSH